MPTTLEAPADRSTRPLSDVARHLVIPEGIVDTLWFDVEERCREFGDEFDAWQDGLGQVALGLDADGVFAATVGGITISIPRQVAKTFLVMRIVVALCTLFPGLTVIWTAHHLRTSTNTFQKMKAFVMRPGVRPYVANGTNQGTGIRDANGEQEIPFVNGSRILFGSRKQGFGRGFDEVDIEVFDEAQILTEQATEDMVPATNQSRFPHGALLFFMGTPPRPTDPGEVFTTRRNEALALKGDAEDFGPPVVAGDAVYIECSADRNAKVDDPEQWAKANPSYPHRTPWRSIQRLRKNVGGIASQMREGLGIWDEEDTDDGSLPLSRWDSLADPSSMPIEDTVRIAVATPPDPWRTSIALAAMREDGRHHVEVVTSMPGDGWVVDRCRSISERLGGVKFIMPPNHKLVAEFEAAGLEVDEITAGEQAAATAAFIAGTRSMTVDDLDGAPELPEGHPLAGVTPTELVDRPPMIVHTGRDVSARNSLKRAKTSSSGRTGLVWAPKKASDDISALHALTWAYGRLGAKEATPVEPWVMLK